MKKRKDYKNALQLMENRAAKHKVDRWVKHLRSTAKHYRDIAQLCELEAMKLEEATTR